MSCSLSISPRRIWFPLVAACLLSLIGCSRTPQVIGDPGVYKELDALYTAVTTKRSDLLQESRKRMTDLRDAGKLSKEGFAEIDGIAAVAAEGKWKEAAPRLYDLMRAQRK